MTSHGSYGGDEGTIFKATQSYLNGDESSLWNFLRKKNELSGILQNHFFWFILILIERIAVDTVFLNINVVITPIYYGVLISLPLAVMVVTSVYIAYKTLRFKGFKSNICLLSILFIFFGSNIIGLFTGGFIECFIIFSLCIREFFQARLCNNKNLIIFIALIDSLIIFAKSYSIIVIFFLILINFKSIKINEKIKYISLLLFSNIIWIYITRIIIPIDDNGPLWISLISKSLSFREWFENIISAFFSFGFGIFFTAPFLLFLFNRNIFKSQLALKIIGIIALEMYLCIYPFWTGAQGLPGQRYILPFLIIFLPEVASSVNLLMSRKSKLLYIIPICLILFFPALDYRNSLSDTYANQTIANDVNEKNNFILNFPAYDLTFHPGIFAWRILASNTLDDQYLKAASSRELIFNPNKIFPMSSISRIIFLLSSEKTNRIDLQNARTEVPIWIEVWALSVLKFIICSSLIMYSIILIFCGIKFKKINQ